MTTPPKKPKPHPPAREDRVAAALRENLRKRKLQAQTRATLQDDSKDEKQCP